jgi:uncharacterized protein (TIGR02246 family)
VSEDERKIRELVETWMTATRAGDLETVLGLMSDDVVFLVPGREPFGKDVFTQDFVRLEAEVDGRSRIEEVKISGDWAYIRTALTVTMTPKDGTTPTRRSGTTLSIVRKRPDGGWVLARDANLLGPAGRA